MSSSNRKRNGGAAVRTVGATLGLGGAAMAMWLGTHSATYASEGVPSVIAACKAIADDRQRLRCLDDAVATLDAPAAATDQDRERELAQRELELKRREAVLEAKSKAAERSGSLFGIQLSSPDADDISTAAAGLPESAVERDDDGSVEAIRAAVRAWSYNARGQIKVVLDNGQIWSQIDNVDLQLSKGKQHRVRISRGALGGFRMTVDAKNQPYKIRRIAAGG